MLKAKTKILQSIEKLCFLLCKNGNDRAELKNIRELSNASDKRPKIKSFLAKRLAQHSTQCLIYDNASDLNALKLWLPLDDSLFKNGRIIVTTRNENIQNIRFPFEMKMIKVPYLSHREKKALFYRINKRGRTVSQITSQTKVLRNRCLTKRLLHRLVSARLASILTKKHSAMQKQGN